VLHVTYSSSQCKLCCVLRDKTLAVVDFRHHTIVKGLKVPQALVERVAMPDVANNFKQKMLRGVALYDLINTEKALDMNLYHLAPPVPSDPFSDQQPGSAHDYCGWILESKDFGVLMVDGQH